MMVCVAILLRLVEAVSLERDCFSEDECRCSLFSSFAKGLTFLRAIDPTEADTFWVVVVQDFEGVAVKEADAWTIFRPLSKRKQNDIRQLDRNSVS